MAVVNKYNQLEMTRYEVPSEQFFDENGSFSGEIFVDYLGREGSKIPYDNQIPKKGQLPPYYDETKFRRAQAVFREYMVNLLFVKLAGLVTLLFHQTATKIIMLTNRSSTPETACIRYKSTIKHILTWYTSDFSENSALWKSIDRVKLLHYSANLQASAYPDIQQITQCELAATVTGFIGYAIAKPECFGLSSMTDEDCEALVYFWRVVGYLLGVDDRFNVCRVSLQETRLIFISILNKFKAYAILKDPDCLRMQFAAIEGISMFGPSLQRERFLNFTYDLMVADRNTAPDLYFPLKFKDRLRLLLFKLILRLLRFQFIRHYANNAIIKITSLK